MSQFRIRFQIEGAHVYCTLYVTPTRGLPFGKCGDFVVRKGEEFKELVRAFSGADFVGQNPAIGIVEASKQDAA
jgi:hypothetical protein